MRYFLRHLLRDRSGQGLIEIMIGLAIGAILIGTASFGVAFILRSSSTNQNLGVASETTQGLLEKVRSFSNANWQNVYGLQKSSSTQYFLVASGTSLFAVQGKEGIFDNDVTNGLIGEWGFDEDVNSTSTTTYDVSGNGNNGTFMSGPTRASSTCMAANCLVLNGAGAYVNVPSASAINFTSNGTFSISVWVNPNTFSTTWRRGIMRQENYTVSGYRFGFDATGKPLFWTSQSGGTLNLTGATQLLTLNKWNFLVVTYNNQQASMYLNGAIIASSTGTYVAGSNALQIGMNVNSEPFSGLLDDVRVYNRALSASEVSQVYKAGIFDRYFYIENVCRSNDASSTITGVSSCGGGSTDDPLTQKATAVSEWVSNGKTAQFSLAAYLTRWKNFLLRQTDWSGGAGVSGPITVPDNSYDSGTNVTTTPLGSFQIQNLSQ